MEGERERDRYRETDKGREGDLCRQKRKHPLFHFLALHVGFQFIPNNYMKYEPGNFLLLTSMITKLNAWTNIEPGHQTWKQSIFISKLTNKDLSITFKNLAFQCVRINVMQINLTLNGKEWKQKKCKIMQYLETNKRMAASQFMIGICLFTAMYFVVGASLRAKNPLMWSEKNKTCKTKTHTKTYEIKQKIPKHTQLYWYTVLMGFTAHHQRQQQRQQTGQAAPKVH